MTFARGQPVSPELIQEAAADVSIRCHQFIVIAWSSLLHAKQVGWRCCMAAVFGTKCDEGRVKSSPRSLTLQLFRACGISLQACDKQKLGVSGRPSVSQFLLYEGGADSWCCDHTKFLPPFGWKHHFCRRRTVPLLLKSLSEKKGCREQFRTPAFTPSAIRWVISFWCVFPTAVAQPCNSV